MTWFLVHFQSLNILVWIDCWNVWHVGAIFIQPGIYVDNQAIYLNYSKTIVVRQKFVTPGFTVEKYVVLKSLIEYYERVQITNFYEF